MRALTRPGWSRLPLAALVVAAGLLGSGGVALAHPFGPPPTARISAEGRTITIDWSATPDDAVAIGELLDVMPAGSVEAYRQESAAQVAPSSADEAALSASPALHDYLTEHVVAIQNGQQCRARVPAIPDFVHKGARVLLRCPEDVGEVLLRITLLHDIHPAYRTVAVGRDTEPMEAVFTVTAPEHAWRFGATAAGSDAADAGVAAVAVGALVLALLAVGGWWAWRR